MLLNLRSDEFILKALQNGFALLYRQSHIRRRDLARALNHRNLVLNGFTSNHLSYQLYCPFHPSTLRHPTTLHALRRESQCAHENKESLLVHACFAPPANLKNQIRFRFSKRI
jgi:hypothetical protein